MHTKIIFLPLLVFILNGCTSLMSSKTDQYSGQIQSGIYTNQIGNENDGSTFSIAVPQAKNPEEYKFLQVSDKVYDSFTVAIFGPANHDFTQYTVVVAKHNSKISNTEALDHLQKMSAQNLIETSRGRLTLNQIYSKELVYKGNPARYIIYTFSVPMKNFGIPLSDNATATEAELIIIYPTHGAILDMIAYNMGPGIVIDNAMTDQNRTQVINMSWPVLNHFYDSFVIHDNESAS